VKSADVIMPARQAAAIAPADFATVLEILPDLYRLQDLSSLAPVMLAQLDRIIPSLMSTYNEIDLATGKTTIVTHPPERAEEMASTLAAGVPALASHPLMARFASAEQDEILSISDLTTREEWLRNPFYLVAQRPVGLEDSLVLPLMNSMRRFIFICFNRGERSFSARERELAEMIRPHLVTAYENAREFTEAKALSLLSISAMDRAELGIALVDANARVVHMNSKASGLLDAYFRPDPWRRELPDELVRWIMGLGSGDGLAKLPLFRQRGEGPVLECRTATIEGIAQRILLLQEKSLDQQWRRYLALGISERQAEVLYWVGEGKSNADIATILDIAKRTVDKHLEAIYAKLQVENRTAALRVLAERFGQP
jgi:DNA-binding CsgD family transcriptional regulator